MTTELDRLAASRPQPATRAEDMFTAAERRQLVDTITATPRPGPSRRESADQGATPRRTRRRWAAPLAAATAVVALAAGTAAIATRHDRHSQSPAGRLSASPAPDVVLVVRYASGIRTNDGVRPRSISQISAARDCLAWVLDAQSQGPYSTYEVHLRVTPTAIDAATHAVEGLVRTVQVTRRAIGTFTTPPRPLKGLSLGQVAC